MEAKVMYDSKLKSTYVLGEIIKDFVEGAGLYVCIGFLALFWIITQRNAQREVTKMFE